MTLKETYTLRNGVEIPKLGLGTWLISDADVVQAVKDAVTVGYRHIDTAQAYGNEESVGKALRDSGVPRGDVFVTTKFYPRARSKDPAAEAERSLARLGIDRLDLYVIHWPEGGPTWAWPGMQQTHERGYARSIGISNFSVRELDALLAEADVKPVVNQVQFSPFKYRRALLEACEANGVALEAYSPFMTGRRLKDRKVAEVAERNGRTPAQVLIRWGIQREVVEIPKSEHRERIEANGQVFDFELTDDDMAELDALDETGGTAEAQENKWWT